MKRFIVALTVAFSCILFGCASGFDADSHTDSDPLSQILYAQPAKSENAYVACDELAELFDNITDDSFEENMSVASDIPENSDLHDAVETEESVQAFSYSDAYTVWIPASGKKYHKKPDCSGMKNPSEVLKKQAELEGYTACKRCF